MNRQYFGVYDSTEIYYYTLENRNGITVKIADLGGTVLSLAVPDRDGNTCDVLLGYETLEEYIADDCYFNCLVGRYANRIAKGHFVLNGKDYTLACNDEPNHLHGGTRGLNRKIWQPVEPPNVAENVLRLSCTSADGEEGYPGNINIVVTYTLTDDNEFIIEYGAVTDADTILCLTWHGYFNLAGRGTICDHELRIRASTYTPVDPTYIPTGEIHPLAGTCLDFRESRLIGEALDTASTLLLEGGFDHNFVLDEREEGSVAVAVLFDKKSGRRMEMFTTEPALQFYSGNFLDGRLGKGRRIEKYAGLCLEAQHYPDSPNNDHFPSVKLTTKDVYTQRTVYRFSVE